MNPTCVHAFLCFLPTVSFEEGIFDEGNFDEGSRISLSSLLKWPPALICSFRTNAESKRNSMMRSEADDDANDDDDDGDDDDNDDDADVCFLRLSERVSEVCNVAKAILTFESDIPQNCFSLRVKSSLKVP